MDTIYTVDGQKIVATLAGEPKNPPVFLLHGWTSHRGVWRQTLPALQEKYYCIAPDLLGFGSSDKPAKADYSIPMQAQRIIAMADALGFKSFSLIGHSMGGQIAMCIAAAVIPSRVEKMVSVAGVVTGQLSERAEKVNYRMIKFARNRPWLYRTAQSLVSLGFYRNSAFRVWFYEIEKIPWKHYRNDCMIALNPACHISNAEAGKAIHEFDASKYLHKMKAQALFISGSEDGTVPVDQARLAQTIVAGSKLAIIQKCGHFPMYEKTNQYLKALTLLV
jgi:pimeloyl-ACP methyl ester carboxylesterase